MRADSGLFCPWLYFQYVAQSQALLHRKGFENEYVHIRISHNRRLAVIFLTTRPVLEKTFDDPQTDTNIRKIQQTAGEKTIDYPATFYSFCENLSGNILGKRNGRQLIASSNVLI